MRLCIPCRPSEDRSPAKKKPPIRVGIGGQRVSPRVKGPACARRKTWRFATAPQPSRPARLTGRARAALAPSRGSAHPCNVRTDVAPERHASGGRARRRVREPGPSVGSAPVPGSGWNPPPEDQSAGCSDRCATRSFAEQSPIFSAFAGPRAPWPLGSAVITSESRGRGGGKMALRADGMEPGNRCSWRIRLRSRWERSRCGRRRGKWCRPRAEKSFNRESCRCWSRWPTPAAASSAAMT